MPKIRHSRTKKPPEGFEDIEETLQEFARKMKDGNISYFNLLSLFLSG
jgi:hypothetical protein